MFSLKEETTSEKTSKTVTHESQDNMQIQLESVESDIDNCV